MTDEKFSAILAKNGIAEALRDGESSGNLGEVIVSTHLIRGYLNIIEDYLGESNQPNIAEILEREGT